MMTPLVTSLLHFHQFKNMVYILALFGLFWLLFKKLGDFFSKSSGHPGPHLIRLTDLDELFKASGDSKIVRAPGY
jgi:hypothetical protein